MKHNFVFQSFAERFEWTTDNPPTAVQIAYQIHVARSITSQFPDFPSARRWLASLVEEIDAQISDLADKKQVSDSTYQEFLENAVGLFRHEETLLQFFAHWHHNNSEYLSSYGAPDRDVLLKSRYINNELHAGKGVPIGRIQWNGTRDQFETFMKVMFETGIFVLLDSNNPDWRHRFFFSTWEYQTAKFGSDNPDEWMEIHNPPVPPDEHRIVFTKSNPWFRAMYNSLDEANLSPGGAGKAGRLPDWCQHFVKTDRTPFSLNVLRNLNRDERPQYDVAHDYFRAVIGLLDQLVHSESECIEKIVRERSAPESVIAGAFTGTAIIWARRMMRDFIRTAFKPERIHEMDYDTELEAAFSRMDISVPSPTAKKRTPGINASQ